MGKIGGFMLVALISIAALCHQADAISCYCTACINTTAGNNVDGPNCLWCSTTTTGALGITVSTVKTCGLTGTCSSGGISIPGIQAGNTNCCSTNLCNGASRNVQLSVAAALVTVVTAFFFSRL